MPTDVKPLNIEPESKDHEITVSIIVPMRNEEKHIARCLESIMANDFPREQMEIIVADGSSDDRSREIVNRLTKRYPQIRLIDNPKRVVSPGLNAAILISRGQYIVRMDAHSEYPPDYIAACVRELNKGKADVVGGRLITQPGAKTAAARAIALISQHPFGVGNSGFRLGWQGRYVDTVPFGAFHRDVFERVGLFRESLVRHQDFEMNARIRHSGGKIFLSPEISLTYYNLATLAQWLKRSFRDPLWVGRAWMRYPITFCWRHGAPLALLLGLLVPLLLSPIFRFAPLLSLATAVLYLVFMLGSSIYIATRHGLKLLPILTFLFVSLHLLYGFGVLTGILTAFTLPKESASVSSPCERMLEAS
jgi:glycosyltransferase involved in cell wall biosynthesis